MLIGVCLCDTGILPFIHVALLKTKSIVKIQCLPFAENTFVKLKACLYLIFFSKVINITAAVIQAARGND